MAQQRQADQPPVAHTAVQFLLLVAAVLASSLFLLSQSMYLVIDQDAEIDALGVCADRANQGVSADRSVEEAIRVDQAMSSCARSVDLTRGQVVAGGVGVILALAFVLMLLWPRWRIRRRRLIAVPAADLAGFADHMRGLCHEAGLRRIPVLLWNPLDPHTNAVAFGRPRRRYLGMGGGLVAAYFTDRATFDAVIRHEVGHLRHRDVVRSALTVTLPPAWLAAGVAPALVAGQLNHYEWQQVGWRAAVWLVIIYAARNGVLRTREHYADLYAAHAAGSADSLQRVLAVAPTPRHRLLAGFSSYHPQSLRRQAVVAEPRQLTRGTVPSVLAATVVVAAAIDPLAVALHWFVEDLVQGWSDRLSMLLVGGLLGWLVGLLIWRAAPMPWSPPERARHWLSHGLAVGVGVLIGRPLALTQSLGYPVLPGSYAEMLTWLLILLVPVGACWWLTVSAQCWLAARGGYGRRQHLLGAALGAAVVGWTLTGVLEMRDSAEYVFGPGSAVGGNTSQRLLDQFGGQHGWLSVQELVWAGRPATGVLLVLLWAFPLAAIRLAEHRTGAASAASAASAAPVAAARRRARRCPVALVAGICGTAFYAAALQAAATWWRPGPGASVLARSAVRNALALLAIATAGALVAVVVRRLRVVHGLFAAWLAAMGTVAVTLARRVLAGDGTSWNDAGYLIRSTGQQGLVKAAPLIAAAAFAAARYQRNRPHSHAPARRVHRHHGLPRPGFGVALLALGLTVTAAAAVLPPLLDTGSPSGDPGVLWFHLPAIAVALSTVVLTAAAGRTVPGPRWAAPAALLAVAAAAAATSLFLPYLQSGTPLASSPAAVWGVLPAICGWLIAAVLVAVPHLRDAGIGTVIGTTAAALTILPSSLEELTRPQAELGPGAIVAAIAWAAALCGAVSAVALALSRGALQTGSGRPAGRFALLGVGVAAVYAVGVALPWSHTTIYSSKLFTNLPRLNTDRLTEDCCTLAQTSGWWQLFSLAQIAVMALLAVTVPYLRPARCGAAALISAAAVLAGTLSMHAAGLATSLDLYAAYGWTAQEIQSARVVVEQTPLPGAWVSLAGLMLVVGLGVAWAAALGDRSKTLPEGGTV